MKPNGRTFISCGSLFHSGRRSLTNNNNNKMTRFRSYKFYLAGQIVSDNPVQAKIALIEKIGSLENATLFEIDLSSSDWPDGDVIPR
jgi:hypothetical protein